MSVGNATPVDDYYIKSGVMPTKPNQWLFVNSDLSGWHAADLSFSLDPGDSSKLQVNDHLGDPQNNAFDVLDLGKPQVWSTDEVASAAVTDTVWHDSSQININVEAGHKYFVSVGMAFGWSANVGDIIAKVDIDSVDYGLQKVEGAQFGWMYAWTIVLEPAADAVSVITSRFMAQNANSGLRADRSWLEVCELR